MRASTSDDVSYSCFLVSCSFTSDSTLLSGRQVGISDSCAVFLERSLIVNTCVPSVGKAFSPDLLPSDFAECMVLTTLLKVQLDVPSH
jgi:hypothetical protein